MEDMLFGSSSAIMNEAHHNYKQHLSHTTGLDAMFGTSAAIMNEEKVAGFHIVMIANFCRCGSPEMLQVLKRDCVKFVGHVAKAMKRAPLPAFQYALEILEFFQGFSSGAKAIKADPELLGALGSVHRHWVYDLGDRDSYAMTVTQLIYAFVSNGVMRNLLTQYERWIPFTDHAVPALVRRLADVNERNDQKSLHNFLASPLGLWSHPHRLSSTTQRHLWDAGAPLFVDTILEAGATKVSQETRRACMVCIANLLSTSWLSRDEIRPVKSKLMAAFVATVSQPTNNALESQMHQMMLQAFANLAGKGQKCCMWILRDCMTTLLHFISNFIPRQTARADADPILDAAVDVVYIVFNTLVDDNSEDGFSFAIKPADCGRLRSSGIDAIAESISIDMARVIPEELGPSGHTRHVRMVGALHKCSMLFASLMNEDERGMCAVCGATENLKACSKCHVVQYCSREHQKEAWKSHKVVCESMKQKKQRRREEIESHGKEFQSGAKYESTCCLLCKTPEDKAKCPHHGSDLSSEPVLSDDPTPLPSTHTASSLVHRRVRLCGLAMVEMNGREGKALKVAADDPGRVVVQLDDGSKKKIKSENLTPLD